MGLRKYLAPVLALSIGAFAAVAHARPQPRVLTVVAAGDIACDAAAAGDREVDDRDPSGCRQSQTAALIASLHPDAVLPLGDEQYPSGSRDSFDRGYAPSWGRFNAIAHPVPGNHEYQTPNAAGYFGYFGKRAGSGSTGYYSFDAGAWHFIALNGNCWRVGGCAAGSPQERWLRADLAAHRGKCVLAYWHQPRFSSALHGSDTAYEPFWRDLYDAKADVVLNGHDHDYERFAPQRPDGSTDVSGGIREFVVGTGGKSHYRFGTPLPTSEMRDNIHFGVLVLTASEGTYTWAFRSAPRGAPLDSGSGACHAK